MMLDQRRLNEQEQCEKMIRLGICDGGYYVVEPDGTFRAMTLKELEQELTGSHKRFGVRFANG
jgi:hypothetical protein